MRECAVCVNQSVHISIHFWYAPVIHRLLKLVHYRGGVLALYTCIKTFLYFTHSNSTGVSPRFWRTARCFIHTKAIYLLFWIASYRFYFILFFKCTADRRLCVFIISLRFHLVYMQIGHNTPARTSRTQHASPRVSTLDTIVLSRFSAYILCVFVNIHCLTKYNIISNVSL